MLAKLNSRTARFRNSTYPEAAGQMADYGQSPRGLYVTYC
jgi:hypothetical protein